MKVSQMISSKGNAAANQFIITGAAVVLPRQVEVTSGDMFQSYNSNIVFNAANGAVYLDETYWDYSRTTGKYRNQFLGETKKETQAKIDSGEYILTNLN